MLSMKKKWGPEPKFSFITEPLGRRFVSVDYRIGGPLGELY